MPEDLLLDPVEADRAREELAHLPSVTLEPADVDHLELLLGGALLPRRGYDRGHPLRVGAITGTTEVAEGRAGGIQHGQRVALRDPEGVPLALLDVTEVLGTADDPALAGTVHGLQLPTHHDLADLRVPATTLAASWAGRAVVGTIVDRPLHPPDVAALRARADALGPDAGVLLLVAARDAFDRWSLARSLKPALDALGHERARAVLLPGDQSLGDLLEAGEVRSSMLANHGVVVPFDLPATAEAHHATLVEAVARGRHVAQDAAYDEVMVELRRALRPPTQRGLVVFFTGLSGSGKSTVAQVVTARLREAGEREVTLLDGDVVRTHLSAGLGFSAEDRDRNVRRIGWVAAEIGRHGGTAIACPIAPYEAARQTNRQVAETAGADYVLVHVATPLDVCEARDRKGLYAKARAGLITGFTGIDDPYEAPADADVTIDTSDVTAQEAAAAVLAHLEEGGWITRHA